MLELEQAVEKILASIPAPQTETIPLAEAFGRVVAEKILAATDLPPFDNSAVDGYAVRAQDIASATAQNPVMLPLAGCIPAGEHFTGELQPGQCIRIFTGSPVPPGADAVVMQEDTRPMAQDQTPAISPNAGTTSPSTIGWDLSRLGSGERNSAEGGGPRGPSERERASHWAGVRVQILDSAKPWENIRFHGEDVKRGAVIAQSGERLGAAHVALLASTGAARLKVNRRPTVALLATGSELKEASGNSTELAPGQIYESNRAALAPLIAATGAIPKIYPIVPDTPEATRTALARALSECDLVITCGGVSVGEMDFVKGAFEQLGGQLDFWKVAIKPGRPFVFGRIGEHSAKPGSAAVSAARFLFGLPGNPISAFVTFLLLARPALLRWQGATNVALPTTLGILAEPISNPDHRRHFMRVIVDPSGKVCSAGTQASHILSSLALANGVIDVPPKTTFAKDATVQVLRWEY